MSMSSSSYALHPSDNQRPKVAYFYDPDIGSYYYGPGHPMKPQRIRMTHSLVLGYDLYKHMEVYRPHDGEHAELVAFHDATYINFLSEVNVDNCHNNPNYANMLSRFNLGEVDCPVFDGLFELQSSCAGASIDAAIQLNHRNCDIAVNWSGGLHHAKRSEAAGFCYVNDIVLCILELLKYHTRVMYIDIDIHHGDGVEEAFYLSHRVMTVSFHKYGDFFPGTGDVTDVGAGAGKYYAVNVPLNDGIRDEEFLRLFKEIMPKCIEKFRPEALVLQCGADSITGDRLGTFNLTTLGHGACVEWIKSLGYPLVLLGGGGYTIKNVARAWLYETAIALNKTAEISNKVPVNEFYEYFHPNYNLHLEADPLVVNKNSREYLEELKTKVFQHLSHLDHAPSVQFSYAPVDFFNHDNDDIAEAETRDFDWAGGGLGIDYTETDISSTTLLRRAVKHGDDPTEPDRDQKSQQVSIMAGLRPE